MREKQSPIFHIFHPKVLVVLIKRVINDGKIHIEIIINSSCMQ